jgi:hypothetical protein
MTAREVKFSEASVPIGHHWVGRAYLGFSENLGESPGNPLVYHNCPHSMAIHGGFYPIFRHTHNWHLLEGLRHANCWMFKRFRDVRIVRIIRRQISVERCISNKAATDLSLPRFGDIPISNQPIKVNCLQSKMQSTQCTSSASPCRNFSSTRLGRSLDFRSIHRKFHHGNPKHAVCKMIFPWMVAILGFRVQFRASLGCVYVCWSLGTALPIQLVANPSIFLNN